MFQAWVEPEFPRPQINASFTQGDDVSWDFQILINPGTGNVPLNLTGSIIKMTIAFPMPLILSTGNGGITITDAVNGKFSVNISTEESADFLPGNYLYDLWIQSQLSPPIENQYFTGTIYINESITEVP